MITGAITIGTPSLIGCLADWSVFLTFVFGVTLGVFRAWSHGLEWRDTEEGNSMWFKLFTDEVFNHSSVGEGKSGLHGWRHIKRQFQIFWFGLLRYLLNR